MSHEGFMGVEVIRAMTNVELVDKLLWVKRESDSGIADSDKMKAELLRRLGERCAECGGAGFVLNAVKGSVNGKRTPCASCRVQPEEPCES